MKQSPSFFSHTTSYYIKWAALTTLLAFTHLGLSYFLGLYFVTALILFGIIFLAFGIVALSLWVIALVSFFRHPHHLSPLKIYTFIVLLLIIINITFSLYDLHTATGAFAGLGSTITLMYGTPFLIIMLFLPLVFTFIRHHINKTK